MRIMSIEGEGQRWRSSEILHCDPFVLSMSSGEGRESLSEVLSLRRDPAEAHELEEAWEFARQLRVLRNASCCVIEAPDPEFQGGAFFDSFRISGRGD